MNKRFSGQYIIKMLLHFGVKRSLLSSMIFFENLLLQLLNIIYIKMLLYFDVKRSVLSFMIFFWKTCYLSCLILQSKYLINVTVMNFFRNH